MTGRKRVKEPAASFEDDLKRLEEIVEQLEQGNVSLEDSLRIYEEGIVLSKRCMTRLSQAERKLEVLRKTADNELWEGSEPTARETEESGGQ